MSKCIVLGVTGGIACYKVAQLASQLKQADFDVHVVMTQHAKEFILPLTFETLTGNEVVSDMFAPHKRWQVEHVSLAKRADLFVICPATANVIGKIASGIADDFLTTTVMATKAPVLVCPAMNAGMYSNPSVQSNIALLKERGYAFVDPEEGRLSNGDMGMGRLADLETIYQRILGYFHTKDLAGKTVMITAGPTREEIDPVRYITNHSSGKMGYAIAEAAQERGAEVILISGPVQIAPPKGVSVVNVTATEEMRQAVLDHLDCADIVIKSAAPSDFRVKQVAEQKIKRHGDLTLELVENTDIAAEVGRIKGDKTLVVFAAETENLIENAMKKIKAKNADLVVANDVSGTETGFNSEHNAAVIIDRAGNETRLPVMTKREMADRILDAALNI